MKHIVQHFCLWMVILLPFTTYAELTGEIIMRYPGGNFNELHITTIDDPEVSRNIYRQQREIEELSVQKNGDMYITASSVRPFTMDIFLSYIGNRNARNITQGNFKIIYDISMSVKGDIVFTNMLSFPPSSVGIYYISNNELAKNQPKIERLEKVAAYSVDFSPDGKQVVFANHDSIFIKDLQSGKLTRLIQGGSLPTFSPHGRKLAYVNSLGRQATILSIISLGNLPEKKRFYLKEHFSFVDLKWSPDGKYLMYTVENIDRQTYSIYSVSVEDGSQEKVLDELGGHYIIYDWTEAVLPVHPAGLITTTWGNVKAEK